MTARVATPHRSHPGRNRIRGRPCAPVCRSASQGAVTLLGRAIRPIPEDICALPVTWPCGCNEELTGDAVKVADWSSAHADPPAPRAGWIRRPARAALLPSGAPARAGLIPRVRLTVPVAAVDTLSRPSGVGPQVMRVRAGRRPVPAAGGAWLRRNGPMPASALPTRRRAVRTDVLRTDRSRPDRCRAGQRSLVTVTGSSFFSSFTSCFTFGLSHWRLPPMLPETGMFTDLPSPPETSFMAKNILASR